jgi:hypothetical protein
MARAIRHHRPRRNHTGRGNIIELKVEVAVRVAIAGMSSIQFNHLFRILLAGIAVGSLPIAPGHVHGSDKVASELGRIRRTRDKIKTRGSLKVDQAEPAASRSSK